MKVFLRNLALNNTFILYDLEAVGKNQDDDFMEIIQVAACKVRMTSEGTEVLDTFESYVRPVFHSKINKKINRLTHIDDKDVKKAPYYYDVIPAFLQWAGIDSVFVSWGHDEDMLFVNNFKHYYFDFPNLFFLDLQFVYDCQNHKKLRTGLKKALEEQNCMFEGQQHSALADSFNMLPLFTKYKEAVQNQIHKELAH